MPNVLSPVHDVYAAVDIGASSGRVILGRMGADGPSLEVVHRFPNGVQEIDGALRWDIRALFAEVLRGLTLARERAETNGERVVSIGVDTWAVDYGLMNDDGNLAALPYSYRDGRTAAAVEKVHQRVPFEHLYELTGLQFLPFNTVYQLAAEPSLTGQALLIPDLLGFWLTGKRRCEVTNASTTGLLDASTGSFAAELFDALQIPCTLFPSLIEPGETLGTLLPSIAAETGLSAETAVVAVGSHDTASAVAAVPASSPNFAYISSGTWSLVGVELAEPILSEAGRAANFTNERGVDGTIRYLRNCGGLWLLQECLREWGPSVTLEAVLAEAELLPDGGPVIDADSDDFIVPDNMPARIRAAADAALESEAAVVRCILDSLALVYARTLRQAAELAGRPIDVVHIVGGGSQNRLLCRLTADATGLPVVAGPVEATALGNVLVQARANGALGNNATLAEIRAAVRRTAQTQHYQPNKSLSTI
ncbi:rhamnulokinase [Arthrobacter sp. JZ12]|uniref:rhamnulokinase n=1 Tax=Arthrobacter sp. JZ12 TaxID=2654190 RepID=UPI002B45E6D9|nr:rhamnulokinase family protein [Arthrobacter sp. JZ12]WRH26140.1 rhamnulokinase [Arthrobacter sp. JZ12]